VSAPAYAHYRESRIEWLGNVPTHWADTRLRFVVRLNPSKSEVSGRARDEEVSFIPMDAIGEDGSVRLDQTRALGDVESGYTYVRNGDVAVAKITPCFENGKGAIMRDLVGGVGFGTTELIVARPLADNSPDFVHWLFNSTAFRKLGEGSMYGAGGQKRVPDDFVRDFPVALPPPAEQAAIAAFLDRETGKIDALVEAQTRLIELLKEKRQAVISRAVTKGLDPAAPMKDSGVEWLGRVPAHWEVVALRYLADCCDGKRVPLNAGERAERPGTVPYWGANAIMGYVDQAIFDEELVLLGEDGAPFFDRTRPVAFRSLGPVWPNNHIHVLRPSSHQSALFLTHALNTTEYAQFIDGSTRDKLTQASMMSIPIAVPPLAEQIVIETFISKETGKLDELMKHATAAILLLQERRAALISAAVTGKIDVRSLAPQQAEAA